MEKLGRYLSLIVVALDQLRLRGFAPGESSPFGAPPPMSGYDSQFNSSKQTPVGKKETLAPPTTPASLWRLTSAGGSIRELDPRCGTKE